MMNNTPVNWDDLYEVEDDYDRSFSPDSLPPYYEGEFWETRNCDGNQ